METTRKDISEVIKDLLLAGFTVGVSMEPVIGKHLKKAKDEGYRECQMEVLSSLTKEEMELEKLINKVRVQTTIEAINTLKKWKEK